MFENESLVGQIGKGFDRRILAYHDDPAGFLRDCILWPKGRGPTSYQLRVVSELVARERIAVRGPRGLGKTALHAWVILWFALTRDAAKEDWKVLLTAPSWSQIEKFIWAELRTKWTPKLNWERIGREPFNMESELMKQGLQMTYGAVTLAAPSNPVLVEGAHADQVLIVLDEAKAIEDEVWNSIQGTLSGAGRDTDARAYMIASSTPAAPIGRFFEIHNHAEGLERWHPIHVTLDEAIADKLISAEWREEMAGLYGEDSAYYRNHALGEFAAQETDSVIRMVDLEAAHERWRACNFPWAPSSQRLIIPVHDELPDLGVIGVDVARKGDDKTVYALRHGDVVSSIIWRKEPDSTVVGREVASLLRQPERPALAVVDAIGVGGPVMDIIRLERGRVSEFVANEKTTDTVRTTQQGFANLRSAAYWNLREMLAPGSGYEVAIPPDEELTADLLAPTWKEEAGGKIRVESKDDTHSRLKRSTDKGDAVVQAFSPTRRASAGSLPPLRKRPGGNALAPLSQRAVGTASPSGATAPGPMRRGSGFAPFGGQRFGRGGGRPR